MHSTTALFFLSALMAAPAVADLNNPVPPIEIVANKFFFSNNHTQFYMRGVAYQSNTLTNITESVGYHDPLADTEQCSHDIPLLKQLGTNVVRVYAIDPTQDHSHCMQLLNDAGIYVISDLTEPGLSIDRNLPTWDVALYERYKQVIDSLAPYPNVLGFFAGNEVTNAPNTTAAAPYVKAALRDTKAYIASQNYRNIPVGYAASDDAFIRDFEADYMLCDSDGTKADFYGVNIYEWCGSNATFENSGYAERTAHFSKYSVPAFFSEYGCNAYRPREFSEVAALYGPQMDDVWSGGIIYMFHQEENDYGLVDGDKTLTPLPDFTSLSAQLATVSPSIRHASDVAATAQPSPISCPESNQKNWLPAPKLPPTPDADLCQCLGANGRCKLVEGSDPKKFGDVFRYICENIDCSEVAGDVASGNYGKYIGCNSEDKLRYLLDAYYSKFAPDAGACYFGGLATLVPEGAASTCVPTSSSSKPKPKPSTSASPSKSDDASGSASASDSASDSASATGSKPGSGKPNSASPTGASDKSHGNPSGSAGHSGTSTGKNPSKADQSGEGSASHTKKSIKPVTGAAGPAHGNTLVGTLAGVFGLFAALA